MFRRLDERVREACLYENGRLLCVTLVGAYVPVDVSRDFHRATLKKQTIFTHIIIVNNADEIIAAATDLTIAMINVL